MTSYTPSKLFPSLICQEYEKCKNELENCSYYGAVFALKDSFECILKMYVLCGALKLHREQGQEAVLIILCNPQKQPSMGTWLAELLPLCGEELEAEQAWKQLNITLRRSRLSGVARATFPDKQSHLVTTVPCFDLYHRPLAWRCPLMDQCFRY